MIALYIILGVILFIAAVIVILLNTNVSFVFKLKDDFFFDVKLGVFSFGGERFINLMESDEVIALFSRQPKLNIVRKRRNKVKITPIDVIDDVSYLTNLIKAIFGEFITFVKVKVCKLKIKIATEDAAETAIAYAGAASALYTAIEFLDSLMTVKRNYKNIGVVPDFTSDECSIDLNIVLKIKILHLIRAYYNLAPSIAGVQKGR